MLCARSAFAVLPSLGSVRFAAFGVATTERNVRDRDPELASIIDQEVKRQFFGLELIPSENYTSRAVLDCLGSVLTNKYSEGLPGARYYGGNQYIDKIERLCQDRALRVFGLTPDRWGVNVQPYSGSPANFAVYTALLNPGQRLMGLELASGGHLTHGHYAPSRRISASSIFFESMAYRCNPSTGLIDYDELEHLAQRFNPKLIIAGASAYARHLDYARFRKICDKVGAYLMADMAHISGLVAAQIGPSPFEYADVVTTTTHKSLRGPRSGMIFFRRGPKPDQKIAANYDLEDKINFAVFPSLQGGPHNNVIGAVATCLQEALSPEFKQYSQQVVSNSKHFAESLKKKGYTLVTGGTDNHLLLVNLNPKEIDGARVEKVLDAVHIAANKNSVPGDTKPFVPGGLRMGTPALTSRGMKEVHFDKVAEFVDRSVNIAIELKKKGGMLKDFDAHVQASSGPNSPIAQLCNEVTKFAADFPVPGIDSTFVRSL